MREICHPANKTFFDALEQEKLDYKRRGQVSFADALSNVLSSLKQYPLPIVTVSDAEALDGVGTEIAEKFRRIIENRHMNDVSANSIEDWRKRQLEKADAFLAFDIAQGIVGSSGKRTKLDSSQTEPKPAHHSGKWTALMAAYCFCKSPIFSQDELMVNVGLLRELLPTVKSPKVSAFKSLHVDGLIVSKGNLLELTEKGTKLAQRIYRTDVALRQIEPDKFQERHISHPVTTPNAKINPKMSTLDNWLKPADPPTPKPVSAVSFSLDALTAYTAPNAFPPAAAFPSAASFPTIFPTAAFPNSILPTPRMKPELSRTLSESLGPRSHPQSQRLRLLVDTREVKGKMADLLNEDACNKSRSLPVGDFLWIWESEHTELFAGIVVERKTVEDLASSIVDGRYEEQKSRIMKAPGVKKCIYIIEGSIRTYNIKKLVYQHNQNNISGDAIHTAVRGTQIVAGFNILFSDNEEHTHLLLKEIGMQIEKYNRPSDKNKFVDFTEFCFQTKKTQDLTVREMLGRMLLSVPGLGPDTVSSFITLLDAEYPGSQATMSNLVKYLAKYRPNDIAAKLKTTGRMLKAPSAKAIADFQTVLGIKFID